MTQIYPKYNLEQFETTIFNGFNFTVPKETVDLISSLSTQVGSPTYIKTPVFQKKDQSLFPAAAQNKQPNKNKRGKAQEITGDDWDSIWSFNETVLVKSNDSVLLQIQNIQGCLNKLTDKTYNQVSNDILSILNLLVENGATNEDMTTIGTSIFEVAANNRFFSKLYANLYSSLISSFQIMGDIFTLNFEKYMLLFDKIECADQNKDYDKFCEVTKQNESRKSISTFFINLTINGNISPLSILNILKRLFILVLDYMTQDNKKSEVDEITEIISILYNNNIISLFEKSGETKLVQYTDLFINEKSFDGIISQLAATKIKTYPSLSSKSIFKFMDMKG